MTSPYRNSRRRKRKSADERDRKNPNPTLLNLHRKMRSRYSLPKSRSGGGRRPPGGYFRHHNFHYGPEPPAYKTPRPSYSNYTRRNNERLPVHSQHTPRQQAVSEKLFQRFIRRFWKEYLENDELIAQQSPEIRQEFPELEPKNQPDENPDVALKHIDRATRILEKYFAREELTPLIEYAEKKREEIIESQFDPERLLRQLEANPTDELLEKTMAQLNTEPRFQEEEVEGCKVETDKLSLTATSQEVEQPLDTYSLPSDARVETKQFSSNPESEAPRAESFAESNQQSTTEGSLETASENLPEEMVLELAVEETESIQPAENELIELVEVDMLENPLLVSDIEALYNEIEAEELEPEEPIEPGY